MFNEHPVHPKRTVVAPRTPLETLGFHRHRIRAGALKNRFEFPKGLLGVSLAAFEGDGVLTEFRLAVGILPNHREGNFTHRDRHGPIEFCPRFRSALGRPRW